MALTTTNYLEQASKTFGNYITYFQEVSTGSSNFWREGCTADSFLDFLLLAWEHDNPTNGITPTPTYFPNSSDLDIFFTAFQDGYLTGTLNNSTIQYDDYSWYALASAKAFDPAYQPVFQTAARLKIFQNIALNLWGVLYEGDYKTMATSEITGLNDVWKDHQKKFPDVTAKITQDHVTDRGLFHKGTANTFNGYYDPKQDPHPSPKGTVNEGKKDVSWPTSNSYYLSKDKNGNPTDSWAVPRFTGGAWQYDALTPDQITWATAYYTKNYGSTGDFLNTPMEAWMDTSQVSLMIGLYLRMCSQMQKAFMAKQQTPLPSTISKRPNQGYIYIDTTTYEYLSRSAGETIVTVHCDTELAADTLSTKLSALSATGILSGLQIKEAGPQITITGPVAANKSELENCFDDDQSTINDIVWDTIYKTQADAIYKFALEDWLGANDDKDQKVYPVTELAPYLKDTDQYHLFNLFGKSVNDVKIGTDHPPILIRERVPTYAATKGDDNSYPPSPAFTPNRYWAGDQGNLIGGLIEYSGISNTNKSVAVGLAISVMKGVATYMTIPATPDNAPNNYGILSTLPLHGQYWESEKGENGKKGWWAHKWQNELDSSPLSQYLTKKRIKHSTVFQDTGDYAAGIGIYLRGVVRGCRLDLDFKNAATTALNGTPSVITANANLPKPGNVFNLAPLLFTYQNEVTTYLVCYLLTNKEGS